MKGSQPEAWNRKEKKRTAAENETLEQKLQECEKELEETKTKLTRSMALNEKLNSENRKLMQQISSWNSLQK